METHNLLKPKDRDPMLRPGTKMVVGAKQLKKALRDGCASHVYLARNADPALTEPIEVMCTERNIQIAWVPSMAELGQICGIEVGAAAAAVIDP